MTPRLHDCNNTRRMGSRHLGGFGNLALAATVPAKRPPTPHQHNQPTPFIPSPLSTSVNVPARGLPTSMGTGRNTAYLNLSSRKSTIPIGSRSPFTRILTNLIPNQTPTNRPKVTQE